MVKTGGAVNNVEGTPENSAKGRTSEDVPVKLDDIVGYPNGINGLVMEMGMLVVPPVLGINSGNPGIVLGGLYNWTICPTFPTCGDATSCFLQQWPIHAVTEPMQHYPQDRLYGDCFLKTLRLFLLIL